MKKEVYEAPVMEIVEFEMPDVIANSPNPNDPSLPSVLPGAD